MLKIEIKSEIINRFVAIKKLLKQPCSSYHLNYSVFIDDRNKTRRYWSTDGHVLFMYEEENNTDFVLPENKSIVLDIKNVAKIKEPIFTLMFENPEDLCTEINNRCRDCTPPMVDKLFENKTFVECKYYRVINPKYLKAIEDFASGNIWRKIPLTENIDRDSALFWKQEDDDYKIKIMIMPMCAEHYDIERKQEDAQ